MPEEKENPLPMPMKKHRRWLFLVMAAVAMVPLLAAACGGDDQKDTQAAGTSTSPTAGTTASSTAGKLDYSKLSGSVRVDGSSTVYPISEAVAEEFSKTIGLPAPEIDELPVKNGGEACLTVLMQRVEAAINARRAEQSEAFPFVLRFILLDSIDRRWKDHLYQMDHLRHAIGLESYAQKDPRLRFKEEGYRLFTTMHGLIKSEVARIFFRVQVQAAPPVPENSSPAAALSAGGFAQRGALAALSEPVVQPNRPAPGDPCPCGSGLLFKRCHGK